ncbi:Piso0_005439 [Millerozyma farinosa CBS 7064]|uniref:Piso0_005439 protein n=1 Tax=Pichia sorbitophila (strain ATCC MYA-4447 / BCRC 22081 / CBS 7064 / NBRC 10061 / NRRL Y-12695) TaxID=559304 RepID=G8XZ07_PICSO|nr:Piso0_005439 [Millerozyma farinosa CBS 7064]
MASLRVKITFNMSLSAIVAVFLSVFPAYCSSGAAIDVVNYDDIVTMFATTNKLLSILGRVTFQFVARDGRSTVAVTISLRSSSSSPDRLKPRRIFSRKSVLAHHTGKDTKESKIMLLDAARTRNASGAKVNSG